MMGQETREVERKSITILKILCESKEPIGATVIAHRLQKYGISLGERAVRYHLKLMDGRGFTRTVDKKDGRVITPQGIAELDCALVGDRVGSALTRIESLAYRTSFDPISRSGEVPVNVAIFPQDRSTQVCEITTSLLSRSFPFVGLAAFYAGGEAIGGIEVAPGMSGLATVSGVTVGGVLLKAGVRLDYRFAGVLQVRSHELLRFAELIEYAGSSLEPSEVFISSKMTSVCQAARDGNGKVLASFCELPAPALPRAEPVLKALEAAGLRCVARIGRVGETICEIPVGMSKVGVVLVDGLNLLAAAVEAGVEMSVYAGKETVDFTRLKNICEPCIR